MARKPATAALKFIVPPPMPQPRVLTVPELRGIRGTMQRLALHASSVELVQQARADLALLDEAIDGERAT